MMSMTRWRVVLAGWVLALSLVPCEALQGDPAGPAPLAPPRAGLVAVPVPPLEGLESAVADQIREQERALNAVIAKPRASDKELADAYGAFARLCHAYEFFDAAEAAYANAIRLAPRDATWLHLLGYLNQQTGRFEEALGRYSAARRLQPNTPVLQAYIGEMYLRLNRLADAREQFQNLVTVFPAVARAGLGEVALREGRFAEAVEYFEAALDRAPRAASVHYSLGMAYRGLGRLEEARSHLMRRGTSVLKPADAAVDALTDLLRGERAQMILGRRAYEAGQFDDAAAAFRKAVEAAPMRVSGWCWSARAATARPSSTCPPRFAAIPLTARSAACSFDCC
jgi:tetratricopeptide (TPR) repeat protein